MNLKKKLRGFFTLTRKADGGFTLVELIVVIAILAILAGVAVPAYSGYIEKANTAADEQLLSALNTAFAAACTINGENNYGRRDVSVSMTAEGDGMAADVTVAGIAKFDDAFNNYYEGGVFKVITELYYDGSIGGFSESKTLTFNFGGKTVTLNSKDVAILSGDNAFSERGSEALLEDVGVLENLLDTGMGEGVLDEIKTSPDFIKAMGSYLGLTQGADEDYEDYVTRVETAIEDTGKVDEVIYSGQIMYAASQAANANEEDINKLFTGTVTGNITVKNDDGSINNEQTMANAALAYGMYTAYLQRHPEIDPGTNEGGFSYVVNGDSFEAYMDSPEGAADLEAYQSAMNMISDNTSNSEVTSSILTNGITDNQALADLMKEVMGK